MAGKLETRNSELETHTVYLAFGANLGDREATLRAARAGLAPEVEVTRCSRLYETPPWGDVEQPMFLNAVCAARTGLEPHALLRKLKRVEQELGRVVTRRWGPRAIDIDILLYDALELRSRELTIPHPHLHERAFVLLPLAELAPELRHPALGTSVARLAAGAAGEGIRVFGPW